jgi:hypothetical protein
MSTDSDEPQVEEVHVEDEHRPPFHFEMACVGMFGLLTVIAGLCLIAITVVVIRNALKDD